MLPVQDGGKNQTNARRRIPQVTNFNRNKTSLRIHPSLMRTAVSQTTVKPWAIGNMDFDKIKVEVGFCHFLSILHVYFL